MGTIWGKVKKATENNMKRTSQAVIKKAGGKTDPSKKRNLNG